MSVAPPLRFRSLLALRYVAGIDALLFDDAALPKLTFGKLSGCDKFPIVPLTALGDALTVIPGPARALPLIVAPPLSVMFPLLAIVPLFCGEVI